MSPEFGKPSPEYQSAMEEEQSIAPLSGERNSPERNRGIARRGRELIDNLKQSPNSEQRLQELRAQLERVIEDDEDAQEELAAYYPGFTAGDFQRLLEMLPVSFAKVQVMADILGAALMDQRMLAFTGKEASNSPEDLQRKYDTTLTNEFTVDDWQLLSKLIAENPSLNLRDVSALKKLVESEMHG